MLKHVSKNRLSVIWPILCDVIWPNLLVNDSTERLFNTLGKYLLTVHYLSILCALKKKTNHLMFIHSSGSVNGKQIKSLWPSQKTKNYSCQSTVGSHAQDRWKSSERLSHWGKDSLPSPAPVKWWGNAGEQQRKAMADIVFTHKTDTLPFY